jgi:carbamoyl-phosphate synthase large subunit
MDDAGECNILFTSVGRRVALVRHFQQTLRDLALPGRVVGVDRHAGAPAFHVVDTALEICPVDSPSYIPTLLEVCRREKIALLFPLIDTELSVLAAHKEDFRAAGTRAVVCDPGLIDLAMNKVKTFDFFKACAIETPGLIDIDAIDHAGMEFPLFMKPADGSASEGIVKINSRRELDFFKSYVRRPILLEYLDGEEVTFDMLFDFHGSPRCVVPRKRIEVRAGEVSKAVIIDDEHVRAQGWKVAQRLAGAVGCINVQCFVQPGGAVKFFEINPRFGGGVPLSLHAGADFPRWILEMARGHDPGDIAHAYRKNVYMLRYDDAIFVEGALRRCDA